jgi:hypothetical protein
VLNAQARQLLHRLFHVDSTHHHFARLGHLTMHIARVSNRSHIGSNCFKQALSPAPMPWIVWFNYMPDTWGSSDLMLYLVSTMGLLPADIIWVFFLYPNVNDRSTKLLSLQRRFGVSCATPDIMNQILLAAPVLIQHIQTSFNDADTLPPTISSANQRGNTDHLPVFIQTDNSVVVSPSATSLPTRDDFLMWARDKSRYVPALLARNERRRNAVVPSALATDIIETTTGSNAHCSVNSTNSNRASTPQKRGRPADNDLIHERESRIDNAMECIRQALMDESINGVTTHSQALFARLLHLTLHTFPSRDKDDAFHKHCLSSLLSILSQHLPHDHDSTTEHQQTISNGTTLTHRITARTSVVSTLPVSSEVMSDHLQGSYHAPTLPISHQQLKSPLLTDFLKAGGQGL